MKKLTKTGVNVMKYNIYIYLFNIILYNEFIGVETSITIYFILHTILASYSLYSLVRYSNFFDNEF